MQRVAQIAVLLALTVLSSCSGGLSEPGTSGNGGMPGVPEGFYSHLANEYTNLAAFERDFMNHEDDALHFTAKARRTLRQQEVEPDRPESRKIPDFAKKELSEARSMLMDALATLRNPENDALLAMAQTRYDCWLTHREDFPQEDAWISCKNEFYDTLGLLDMPGKEGMEYSIYFGQGGTALDEVARETAEEIAELYRDRPHWYVVLEGHTDSAGSKNENQVLSMRRAIAVKHLLGQYGINLDNIAISAAGEIGSKGEEDVESRRVDILVRPHYVAENKEGLKALQGWKHSGEF